MKFLRIVGFVLSLLCLAQANLFAQGKTIIYGVVVDDKTNESLIGVTVMLDDKEGVITDLDGKFQFEVKPGTHTLEFSFLGYAKVKKTVKMESEGVKKLSIRMAEALTELGMVVVSSSQYEKSLAKETVSMEVISQDLIQSTNSRDIGEIVAKTPGVQVQDGQITIRGGSSYSYGIGSRTAVMQDGLALTSADLGESQLTQAPLENAEQVEIIKGASSVIYGSSAINGVVNVITAWPKSAEPTNTVTFYAGAFDRAPNLQMEWWKSSRPNFSGVNYVHGQRIKGLQLVLGTSIDYLNSYLQNADQFRARGHFKTRYQLPKNPSISFGVNGTVQKETSGRFFISQDLDTRGYLSAQGSNDNYTKTNIDPHFQFVNDNGHKLTIKGRWLNVFRQGGGDDIDASSHLFTFDNQYQKSFKNNLVVLTVGAPFSYGTSKSNLFTNVRKNYNVATYAQGEFNYKRLSLVAGLRYELAAVDTLFETTIPVFRSGINYQVGKATFLRASWGQAFRIPSIAERFVAANLIDGVFIVPNSQLKTEKAWNAEIGLKQAFKIKNWVGFFDFSMFWMEYENFVEYRFAVLVPGAGLDECGNIVDPFNSENILIERDSCLDKSFEIGLFPQNVDNARLAGYEVSFTSQGDLGPVKLRSLIGYTYTYPRKADSTGNFNAGDFFAGFFEDMFRRVPEERAARELLLFRVRHLLRLDIEAIYDKYSLGFTAAYGSFPELIPFEFVTAIDLISSTFDSTYQNGSVSRYAEEHKRGDWVLGCRFGYEINDKIKISGIVNNLTNHLYFQRPGKFEPPRSYTARMTVKF